MQHKTWSPWSPAEPESITTTTRTVMSQPKERASRPSKVQLVIIFRGRKFSTAGWIVATGSQTAAATICPKVVIYHMSSPVRRCRCSWKPQICWHCVIPAIICPVYMYKPVALLQRACRGLRGARRRGKTPQTGLSPNLRVLDFSGGVFFVGRSGRPWHQTGSEVKSSGRPLSGGRTPKRQDFVDGNDWSMYNSGVLAFAKIYLHVFLSYIDNINGELCTENICGDWDIFL